MSLHPTNQTYKQQNTKLIRATFKKAFVNAIYASSRTVDVYFAENQQTVIRNIPVAKSVDISMVMVGQRCRIDMFDENNPSDCVLAYTF